MRTGQPRALFSMLDGYRPITNLLGAGDPNVHWIQDRWWMFFGGFQRNFRNNLFSASLPPGASLHAGAAWEITTDHSAPRKAAPLAPPPPQGGWDHYGMHEPCYVAGMKNTPQGTRVPCERVYYTGRGSRRTVGNDVPYAIGVLERTRSGWQRRPNPVIRGDTGYPSALGPKVVYANGLWRMWFRATPREPAKGDQPIAAIHYTESPDGISEWTPPQVFYPTSTGFAHAHVRATTTGYEMLLSTTPNLHGEGDYPQQGLWLSVSDVPSGDVADWSPPQLVMRASEGPVWLRNGFFGSSICAEDDVVDGSRHVFFTGINDSRSWPALALKYLASFRRPPVPAPFHFTIGHLPLSLDRKEARRAR